MEYRISVDINLPVNKVLEILEDAESMKDWQPGLLKYEFLDEDRTAPGARMLLEYDMGGRKVEMIETLEKRKLPESLIMIYETKGVWNRAVNRFESIGTGMTRWTQDNEFKCSGFVGVMAAIMPGSFRRETRKSLNRFKAYAESRES